MLAEKAVGVVVHYLEGSCTIIHPPVGVDGAVQVHSWQRLLSCKVEHCSVQSLERSIHMVQGHRCIQAAG